MSDDKMRRDDLAPEELEEERIRTWSRQWSISVSLCSRRLFQLLRGVIFMSYFLVCGLATHLFQIFGYIYIRPFSRSWYSRYEGFIKILVGAMLICSSLVCPMKLEISSDHLIPNEEVIVMANHQLFNDWVILWIQAYLLNRANGIRIILRGDLKSYPLLGWIMQMFNFIFIRRRLQDDQKTIQEALVNSPEDSQNPLWLLIFPEGTLIGKETIKKSHEFAIRHGYPQLSNVLFPRDAGFRLLMRELSDRISAVYDITMAYDLDSIPSDAFPYDVYTNFSFFSGFFPGRMCIDIRRVPLTQIDRTDEGLQTWIRNAFIRKDVMMSYFREHRRFPMDAATSHTKFPAEYPTIRPWHMILVVIMLYSIFGATITYILGIWFTSYLFFAWIYKTLLLPRCN